MFWDVKQGCKNVRDLKNIPILRTLVSVTVGMSPSANATQVDSFYKTGGTFARKVQHPNNQLYNSYGLGRGDPTLLTSEKKTGHSKTPKHLCEDRQENTHVVQQAHYARRFLMEIIAEIGGYNNPVSQYAPRTDHFLSSMWHLSYSQFLWNLWILWCLYTQLFKMIGTMTLDHLLEFVVFAQDLGCTEPANFRAVPGACFQNFIVLIPSGINSFLVCLLQMICTHNRTYIVS